MRLTEITPAADLVTLSPAERESAYVHYTEWCREEWRGLAGDEPDADAAARLAALEGRRALLGRLIGVR